MKKIVLIISLAAAFTACKRDRKTLEVTDVTPVNNNRGPNSSDDNYPIDDVYKWNGESDLSLGGLSIELK